MSKKSRKRNKKILAAIGIGLGAAALASKRKKDANVEMGLPKADMSTSVPTGPKELGISTAKKDKKNIPQTTKVDTGRKKSMAETSTVPKKRPGITVYSDGSIKAPDKGSGNQVNYANKEKYSTRLDTKPPGASGGTTNSGGSTARGSSTFNDKVRANNAGLKSGGRAGYKHGGSTGSSKSSGCEIKGTSPILLKGKR